MNQINNAQARFFAGSKVSQNYSKSLEIQYNYKAKINGDTNISKLLNEKNALVPKLALANVKNTSTVEFEKREKEIDIQLESALSKYNLTISDIEFTPVCEKCGDTGICENGDCDCFKGYVFEYITSRLASGGEVVDFESSKAFAKTYPKLEKFYDYAEEYCRRYPEVSKQVFVMQGNVGTGKTHLAKGILTKLIADGASGLFLSAFNMEELFVRHMQNATSFKPDQTIKDQYKLLLEIDVLVVDDLGAEIIHMEKVKPYFINLLETRIANGNLTIFTTNLSEQSIVQRYGERFFSRLASKSTVVMRVETEVDLRTIK